MKSIFILLLCVSCTQITPSSVNLPLKADTIIESAEESPPDIKTIKRTAETLYKDDVLISKMEQTIFDSKINEAKDMSSLYKFFISASALMLVGGVFSIAYQQPALGSALIASAIALTSYTTSLSKYFPIIALVSVILLLLAICSLAYKYFYVQRALKDSINTTEIVKDSGASWTDNLPLINKLQHPTSKKIIQSIKNKEIRA